MSLIKLEIAFLQQKVEQDWINSGDMNTRYFQDTQGVWQVDRRRIEAAFIRYYHTLLGTQVQAEAHVSKAIIQEGIVLTREQQHMLCAPFTSVDVKDALWGIDDNKAHGYNNLFF